MIKAVFLDYTGTIVQVGGPQMMEAATRIVKGSTVGGFPMFLEVWWKIIEKLEYDRVGDLFLTEEEIVFEGLKYFERRYNLREDRYEILELVKEFWTKAPMFEDVADFVNNCPVPIFVISNNGVPYITKRLVSANLMSSAKDRTNKMLESVNGNNSATIRDSLDIKSIVNSNVDDRSEKIAGIISGEMARYYKPHKEIFLKGLEVARQKFDVWKLSDRDNISIEELSSGLNPEDILYIGDSYENDYVPTKELGFKSVLLDRKNISSLPEGERVTSLNQITF